MSVYDASKIKVLKGLEGVRKRPAMYIGDTSTRGLHHLVFEVVDNSIDEAMAGYCKNIEVVINRDGSVTVEDDGRGIPVDEHPVYKKPALEIVMTTLHAGGKFDDKAYPIAGGLHGVGVSVVNALSEFLVVEVKRDGKIWRQRFERGEKKSELEVVGEADGTGTRITFMPDPEIFEKTNFSFELLAQRLKELAFLNPGLRIKIRDERKNKERTFYYEGGIVEFVKHLDREREPLHPPIYIKGERDTTRVEVALQYNNSYFENILTFANNIHTIEGGTHLIGFKSALTKTINEYAKKYNLIKEKDLTITGDDTREGLTAVISVKVKRPQFEGQTKTKLGNSEVKGIVESIVADGLMRFLEENKEHAQKIIEKVKLAARSRIAAKKAKEITRRKSFLESDALPGKLADCTIEDPEKAELFIVEGDSAGGSAKQGRDRTFQAILPIRGKILNVEKAQFNKVLSNDPIKTIIAALGTGIGRDDFDADKVRYHKIIIMTDADVDGSHIRTLLLTFFYRYAKELIERGYVYIAQPPLYGIKKGKEEYYAYSDEELEEILKKIGKDGVQIQRYKGLGEMNPEQLWRTTMDPERRILKRVTLQDAEEAERIFTVLMGEKVEPRKEFIEKNARFVRNLDV
ncbi:DNA topoisomerase (ATP-hydrolyzing) subunit B [bacterium]|nr:MAG: DNA topoisomerase (ATP-hydrolyzing) subunit B [bacterium]